VGGPRQLFDCSGYLLPMRSEIGRMRGYGWHANFMLGSPQRTWFTSLGFWEVPNGGCFFPKSHLLGLIPG